MLNGKKTYIVVAGGLLAIGGAFMQGQVDVMEAVNQVMILLGIGGLRMGVSKGE